MPSIPTIWQNQKRVDCVWLLRLWLLLLEIPQWVQGQAAIWPTGGFGGYQQCPAGMFADGSCRITGICFDLKERCINGFCCQQQTGINTCPYGYFNDGTCYYTGICFDYRERCISGVCCQQQQTNYPTNPTYPTYPTYPTNGYPNTGYGYPNTGYGYPNTGYGYPNTGYGYPNTGYGYPTTGSTGYGYPTTGYGYGTPGYGVGTVNPYGTGTGIGVGVGIGYGIGYGISYGGIGGLGCRDQYTQCALYASYCFFESIAEACMASCRLCTGGGLLG